MLIVSTKVGRGMYYLGDALYEILRLKIETHHVAIEDFQAKKSVHEDLERYKIISSRFPWLLYLIYKFPFIYYRKYLREKYFNLCDLTPIRHCLEVRGIKTVICISHRPAFWFSCLRFKEKLGFHLWGLLGEYGRSLGWKYIFWEQMEGFLSPIEKSEMDFPFSQNLQFLPIVLPARKDYYGLAGIPGDKNKVLLVCGFWGQGPILNILRSLLHEVPDLEIHVVCGENEELRKKILENYKDHMACKVYGVVGSLAHLLKACGSIITKPGISTVLEAHASKRKMFLLKGMPVAEDHNAQYAIEYFGAEWFKVQDFKKWHSQNSA
ncbi:MAG: hypothetical protein HQL21_01795 [Candidatus Omnitrophica bacterium]|nr:hypothetical protein [Candidatus Omnitrophota bacterium]